MADETEFIVYNTVVCILFCILINGKKCVITKEKMQTIQTIQLEYV
jgi:hypothetical protein